MARATDAAAGTPVAVLLALVLLVVGGCTTDPTMSDAPGSTKPAASDSLAASPPGPPVPAAPPAPPARFDAAVALADVHLLAGRIGPRLATGSGYRRAVRVVERRFTRLGYDVRREVFDVPAGDSWGVPVRAGRSFNVVAEPAGFDPAGPHLVLGAYLDTVAAAPGAEDNASGVAVLLEVARLAATAPARLPVVLVAFGAEEPRGPGDAMHHFGSQHHVGVAGPARREALRAMVSLDRVGVGGRVPVCTGPLSPPGAQRALLRAAARLDVPALACRNTASDHWPFEKAGFTVARLGSTPYPQYHSPDDVPAVVSRHQLGRTGRVVWEWLR